MVVHPFKPSTQETEEGDSSWAHGQPGSKGCIVRPWLKAKQKIKNWNTYKKKEKQEL